MQVNLFIVISQDIAVELRRQSKWKLNVVKSLSLFFFEFNFNALTLTLVCDKTMDATDSTVIANAFAKALEGNERVFLFNRIHAWRRMQRSPPLRPCAAVQRAREVTEEAPPIYQARFPPCIRRQEVIPRRHRQRKDLL